MITTKQWEEIKGRIKYEYNIPDLSYDVWIKDLELKEVVDGCVIVKIPKGLEHTINYIENKYKNFFQFMINEMFDEKYRIDFVIEKEEVETIYNEEEIVQRKSKLKELRKKVVVMQQSIIDSQNRMIELKNELERLSEFLEEARFLKEESYLMELDRYNKRNPLYEDIKKLLQKNYLYEVNESIERTEKGIKRLDEIITDLIYFRSVEELNILYSVDNIHGVMNDLY